MTAADKIEAARALIEPLTGHTPGPYHNAGIPTAAGRVIADASPKRAHIGSAYKAADVRLFAAAPALRDTVADLTDLADAQAQEIARLREALNRIADFGPSRRHNQNRNDLIACAAVDIAVAALGDAP